LLWTPERISGNGFAKVLGRVGEMETVWGAALAVLFVLATALSSGHIDSSSSKDKDKSEQKDKSEEKDKSEKDKSEEKGKSSSKDKSGHAHKSSSAKGTKKKDIPDVWQLRQ
jgi:cytoskeletal protein RodZ